MKRRWLGVDGPACRGTAALRGTFARNLDGESNNEAGGSKGGLEMHNRVWVNVQRREPLRSAAKIAEGTHCRSGTRAGRESALLTRHRDIELSTTNTGRSAHA